MAFLLPRIKKGTRYYYTKTYHQDRPEPSYGRCYEHEDNLHKEVSSWCCKGLAFLANHLYLCPREINGQVVLTWSYPQGSSPPDMFLVKFCPFCGLGIECLLKQTLKVTDVRPSEKTEMEVYDIVRLDTGEILTTHYTGRTWAEKIAQDVLREISPQ